MGNEKPNTKTAFPAIAQAQLHSLTVGPSTHCLLGPSSVGWGMGGLQWVQNTQSLPLLPPHTFSLFQHRSSPWVAVLWEKSAPVWVLQGTQFLQEMVLCSGVWSSMGRSVDLFSALELLLLLLFWPWHLLCCFSLLISLSSLPGVFFALKYILRELPHTWWMGSALSCSGVCFGAG